jgi:pimeloyl-ACP methyl ester carboxylesterase
VRVYESEPSDGGEPAIVRLPGAGDTAESWTLVTERLSRSARVVTYDRPGMGHSDPVPAADLAAVVETLDAVLAAADPMSPVVLVGHSFGGLLARAYTATHAERVAGLVLVDATPPVIAKDRGVRSGFLISGGLAKVLKALATFGLTRALLAAGAMPLYPEQRAFRRAASPDAYRRWTAAVCSNFASNAGRELSAVLPAAADFGDSLSNQPGVPVAVVFSRAYGARWEQMQRDAAQDLRAVALHSTGARRHNIHMMRPDLVVQGILDVLHVPPPEPVRSST